MMIKRICELRGIISSDQVFRPHFHLRRYKVFVVLIAGTTSPPGQTPEVMQKWRHLLMGQTQGSGTSIYIVPTMGVFFLFIVNPLQSLQISASTSLCTHFHYLNFQAFIGHLRWQHVNHTDGHEHCVSLQTWGRTFWTEGSQWQNRLKNFSKDNFEELLFCKEVRWSWALAHSTVPLKAQGCTIIWSTLWLTSMWVLFEQCL